ncbi:MAG: UDP-N-acetylmuramate--alanine ligase [Elusimicrobia bacterium]|nr:UDP-N-acetylmuramate--alanine ligase [Elusimicrobiota bacterium]
MAKKIHFVGIAGNGMSALAQIHAMSGDIVSGSDRLLDKGFTALPLWPVFKKLNIKLHRQDGSGVTPELNLVVLSSAIEDGNRDWDKAKDLKLPIAHRSELLARHISQYHTVAVSGTCGKSTTAAMIFEILEKAGRSPSIINGAALLSLQERGYAGNIYRGTSNLLVIEADESDGSLTNYHPAIGVFLNLSKDHKELPVLEGYFRQFRANCKKFLVNADEANLAEFRAGGEATFGVAHGSCRAENVELGPSSSSFTVDKVHFTLPHCGMHNVQNAIAAIAACRELDVPLKDCAEGLAGFRGVARRFASMGRVNDIEVIDDFAHNPAKIAAALAAAQLRGKRVLAFYQPHGYAPVKLLMKELVASFSSALRENDMLWMPDIYYIGGTADKTVSSKQLVDAIAANGRKAAYLPSRDDILPRIVETARPGDVIMVMGARDPSITDYARAMLAALKKARTAGAQRA